MSSIVLEYHWFLLIALFKSLGSKHSLRLPFGFITGTIELIHSVCSLTSVIMPSFVSLSNSVLYVVCIAIGTNLGGCCTGLYCSFSLIWYGPPGRVPTPLKMSLYSFRMYSLVMGNLCVLPLSCMESVFHFMCGSTGSVVCCACFALVISVGVVLCSGTWGWNAVFVVFDVGVLYVHKFLESVLECG